MTFFNWLRWLVNGHNLDREAAKGISQLASDLYDQEEATRRDIMNIETQLSQLRAIVTQHGKEQPKPIRQARRMSEVRNFLQQNDEDAA